MFYSFNVLQFVLGNAKAGGSVIIKCITELHYFNLPVHVLESLVVFAK